MNVARKGWCPGALAPMRSGDGLIVRLRLSCGELSAARAREIAGWSERYGNGEIDLTSRGHLQLRGVEDAAYPALIERLAEARLIDGSPEAEAVRNVLVTPFAGLDGAFDVRPYALSWERALTTNPDLWRLPGKFGVAFDAGVFPMGDDSDIRFEAVDIGRHCAERSDEAIQRPPPERLPFGHNAAGLLRYARNDGESVEKGSVSKGAMFVARLAGAREVLGAFPAKDLVAVARTLAAAFRAFPDTPRRMREAVQAHGLAPFAAATGLPVALAPQARRAPVADWLGVHPFGVGVAAPFGRLRASQLAALADAAGAAGLRLTPWRALLIPRPDNPAALAEAAHCLGLIVDPADPLLRVAACAGAPACSSALQETHETARRLARFAPAGEGIWLHVSGCEKGCAHPRPAPLTAVATREGYRLNGEPARSLDALAERIGA